MKAPQHHLDRLFWLCGGNSGYAHIAQKPIKWEFVGDDGYRVCVGKYAKQWTYHKLPVSPLYDCELCKKRGTNKRIQSCFQHADPAYGYEKDACSKTFSRLCLSCLMTLRNHSKQWHKTRQLKLLVNQTKRKLNEST